LSSVLSVMTYGAETLILTQKSAESFRVTQRAMEGSLLGVSLRDRIPSEIIRQRTKVIDVVDRVATMMWAWAGTRDEKWTKRVIEWRPQHETSNSLDG